MAIHEYENLWCEEDMPVRPSMQSWRPGCGDCTYSGGVNSVPEVVLWTASNDIEVDGVAGGIMPCSAAAAELDGQKLFEKYNLLSWMFAESTRVHRDRQALAPPAMALRMSCICQMQIVLYFAQMSEETIVDEDTIVQSILLLDWIIQNEMDYFMRTEPEVLGCVCVILCVGEPDAAETDTLHSLVAFTSGDGGEKEAYLQRIVDEVETIEAEVSSRYPKLVFADFIEQYFEQDEGVLLRLQHFFYKFMTESCASWGLNIYETFVEIALKESANAHINVKILDDYLMICL